MVADQKPGQEVATTYFNGIVRKEVVPLTVEQLPESTLSDFNDQVRLAFPDEPDEAVERVRYLVPYILQAIDWDSYGIPLQSWQLQYYYKRERFLSKTHLKYEDFMAHRPLQEALAALELSPKPTFEFILFLHYYYGMRSELRFSPLEQLGLAKDALQAMTADQKASIDINVGGRHYRIMNSDFVKAAIMAIDHERLNCSEFADTFIEGANRDKIRAIDYFTIKTLLDYLPTHTKRERGGQFSQAERNFGLSVLSLLGRLPDIDREGECSHENNATFDKLMRDFRTTAIPFAMELFL